ncbi:MAG: hypothetical protein K9N23_18015 [Akkermansiaceae bacterium]|nr:hypothetical protein [Akkermansiaceae bacterium]MCF7733591.1 hypothetical protein [Akkermansiaceae bacterium]
MAHAPEFDAAALQTVLEKYRIGLFENAYLATVARNMDCECYRVGGVADHVHLAVVSLLGLCGVLAWRLREGRSAVTVRKIVTPPLGMAGHG